MGAPVSRFSGNLEALALQKVLACFGLGRALLRPPSAGARLPGCPDCTRIRLFTAPSALQVGGLLSSWRVSATAVFVQRRKGAGQALRECCRSFLELRAAQEPLSKFSGNLKALARQKVLAWFGLGRALLHPPSPGARLPRSQKVSF